MEKCIKNFNSTILANKLSIFIATKCLNAALTYILIVWTSVFWKANLMILISFDSMLPKPAVYRQLDDKKRDVPKHMPNGKNRFCKIIIFRGHVVFSKLKVLYHSWMKSIFYYKSLQLKKKKPWQHVWCMYVFSSTFGGFANIFQIGWLGALPKMLIIQKL